MSCTRYLIVFMSGVPFKFRQKHLYNLSTLIFVAEVVKNIGYSKAADWWSFGVLVYEMLAGHSPFIAKSEVELFENILACRPVYPPRLSPHATDLLKNLLVAKPTMRFGNLYRGVMDIKSHPWFHPHDWVPLLYRTIEAPFETSKRSQDVGSLEKPLEIPKSDVMLYEDEFRDF